MAILKGKGNRDTSSGLFVDSLGKSREVVTRDVFRRD
jgi:hypothetical protein